MLSLIIILFIFPFIQSTFNLNEIYPKNIINLNTIKIIHKTKKSKYKPLCVFGVLENNNGILWNITNFCEICEISQKICEISQKICEKCETSQKICEISQNYYLI